MEYNITVIKGDGIGPEVMNGAIEILDVIANKFNHSFNYREALGGGAAYDQLGEPLPQQTIDICKNSDAILFGAVGGKRWDKLPKDQRPEMAILGLRKELGLYANLRPAVLFEALKDSSPLKESVIKDGFDILVVRELTGGIYFGESGTRDTEDGILAYDVECYKEMEIRRIARVGFDMAMKRKKKLTSVDKSNVLESSRLWRKIVIETSKKYPDVKLDHMYIDNATMQVIKEPGSFDVILTSNLFGDILSDEISMLTGSIGLLPSASLGEKGIGLFEPIHGSAPDIAGEGTANPIAMILSAAMMLRFSFNLVKEADAIESSIEKMLTDGYRTVDIASLGEGSLGTKDVIRVIKKYICLNQ